MADPWVARWWRLTSHHRPSHHERGTRGGWRTDSVSQPRFAPLQRTDLSRVGGSGGFGLRHRFEEGGLVVAREDFENVLRGHLEALSVRQVGILLEVVVDRADDRAIRAHLFDCCPETLSSPAEFDPRTIERDGERRRWTIARSALKVVVIVGHDATQQWTVGFGKKSSPHVHDMWHSYGTLRAPRRRSISRASASAAGSTPTPTGTRSTEPYTASTSLATATLTHVSRACRTNTVRRPGRTNALVSSRSSPLFTRPLHTRQCARPVGAKLSRYVLRCALNAICAARPLPPSGRSRDPYGWISVFGSTSLIVRSVAASIEAARVRSQSPATGSRLLSPFTRGDRIGQLEGVRATALGRRVLDDD